MAESNGKGDQYRPVVKKLYDINYDRIFNAHLVLPENKSECDLGLGCTQCCKNCVIGRKK
jgi:hypothetical protein